MDSDTHYSLPLHLLRWFILFVRNSYGVINSPYETYRKLIHKNETLGQSLYILLLCLAYFTFASLVRIGIKNPFILTIQFNKLAILTSLNFLFVAVLLYKIGKLIGGIGSLRNVLLAWSYTLIPTLLWFLITSIIFIFLPPPRTASLPGRIFSILYMGFSLAMLYWKIILYYLTLRFALKLDLIKIIVISFFFGTYVAIYGVLMYRVGIFRIPFI